jgi:hypothetical protein
MHPDPATIIGQWPEIMRLKVSIEAGAMLPSVILRKRSRLGHAQLTTTAIYADADQQLSGLEDVPSDIELRNYVRGYLDALRAGAHIAPLVSAACRQQGSQTRR